MIEVHNSIGAALIKHSTTAHMHFRLGYMQPRVVIDEESEHF